MPYVYVRGHLVQEIIVRTYTHTHRTEWSQWSVGAKSGFWEF